MDDEAHDPAAIPAASIGTCDLEEVAKTNPAAAAEIARLSDLMDVGEESAEQFLQLCQLLVDVGCSKDSEYLLRRNLEGYDGGRQLYNQLFGTNKLDEYSDAVESFKTQFGVTFTGFEHSDFLVSRFLSDGAEQCHPGFPLLSQPFEVMIGYIEQEVIEADVVLQEPSRSHFPEGDYLLLQFADGFWKTV